MARRLDIVVSGMLAGVPGQGGASWAVLQWVLGLAQLGHRVCLVEPVNRGRGVESLATSASGSYFRAVVKEFGLEGRAALLDLDRRESVEYSRVDRILRSSDLLVNLAGQLPLTGAANRIPVRVYVDLDPAFTQFWHQEGLDLRLRGTPGSPPWASPCPVPTLGLEWTATLQPVVLSHWHPAARAATSYTTVANWRSYGAIVSGGVHYGQKVHSWRRLLELPRRTGQRFRIALSIDPAETADLEALRQTGWELVDPARVACDPRRYQEFIAGSRAEIAIAKSGFVLSRCGWFSERSVCYLACGKPALVQDIGLAGLYPTGTGLLTYSSLQQAVEGVREVRRDYRRHAQAARRIAREHFAAERVLANLLEKL